MFVTQSFGAHSNPFHKHTVLCVRKSRCRYLFGISNGVFIYFLFVAHTIINTVPYVCPMIVWCQFLFIPWIEYQLFIIGCFAHQAKFLRWWWWWWWELTHKKKNLSYTFWLYCIWWLFFKSWWFGTKDQIFR